MLSDSCLSVCVSCNVGILWPNGLMNQDATWYGGRPRPRRHCVRWGPSSSTERVQQLPHFSAHFSLTRSPISATAELLLHSLLQSVPILYDGPPLSPKIAHLHRRSGPPSNARFLGPTRVKVPNGIAIGLAVFAEITVVTYR